MFDLSWAHALDDAQLAAAMHGDAPLIVVATQWVKDDVCARYGIAPKRVAVVNPPPVTVAYGPPEPNEESAIAARLGLPARYAFYPAQTWGHKNHERLFEALRQLRDRGIEVPLVCSGHRNARHPEVMRSAAALHIAGQVTFLGFLSPTEIQVVYRRATMLVFPSLFEGWRPRRLLQRDLAAGSRWRCRARVRTNRSRCHRRVDRAPVGRRRARA